VSSVAHVLQSVRGLPASLQRDARSALATSTVPPSPPRIPRLGEILILSEADVEELLDPAGCLEAVEHALVALAGGDIHLPLRPMIKPPGTDSVLALMSVHRRGTSPTYGLKTVAVFPANSARGLDPHQGTVTLYDGETGQVVAVMNASPITAIRTAAASALATRELARDDARVLAIVGTGHQGRAHQRLLPAVLSFDEVLMAGRGEVEEAVRQADVVVTATSSTEPVIRREWLKDGVHINAVGSCFPDVRELDAETVAASTFFTDRRESAENEAGDYVLARAEGAIGPDHIAGELGDVLVGAHPGRTSQDEITVFESLGLAVEDLYAAEYLVQRARETGRGVMAAF
jgi:ornithine cyclodeaminase/alanine dehydrogenase-like protein (mu-crystallin family)